MFSASVASSQASVCRPRKVEDRATHASTGGVRPIHPRSRHWARSSPATRWASVSRPTAWRLVAPTRIVSCGPPKPVRAAAAMCRSRAPGSRSPCPIADRTVHVSRRTTWVSGSSGGSGRASSRSALSAISSFPRYQAACTASSSMWAARAGSPPPAGPAASVSSRRAVRSSPRWNAATARTRTARTVRSGSPVLAAPRRASSSMRSMSPSSAMASAASTSRRARSAADSVSWAARS